MTQVYWIGGAPCAGKTTIANILAQENGVAVHSLDRHLQRHLRQATRDRHPHLVDYRSIGMMDFLQMPADDQVEHLLGMYAEQFSMIMDDIQAHTAESDQPLVVEGANLRPADVAPLLSDQSHAIWLVPTEDFLLDVYPNRGTWVQNVLEQFEDKSTRIDIFDRWMARDMQLANHAADQAAQHDIPLLMVDGARRLLDNAEYVMQHFGFTMPADDDA